MYNLLHAMTNLIQLAEEDPTLRGLKDVGTISAAGTTVATRRRRSHIKGIESNGTGTG